MENLRNKSQDLTQKDYFERFTKLNVYSYTKPNDNKLYIGAKPTEVYSLFYGNTSSTKKTTNETLYVHPDDVIIDQSTLQYYLILGIQDFYTNYYKSLVEENLALKEELTKVQYMFKATQGKKNDARRNLEIEIENIRTSHGLGLKTIRKMLWAFRIYNFYWMKQSIHLENKIFVSKSYGNVNKCLATNL